MMKVNDISPHGAENHYIDPAYIKYINSTPDPSIQMVKTYLSIPIEYPNNSSISLKDIKIKISDFGPGSKYFDSVGLQSEDLGGTTRKKRAARSGTALEAL